jgi:hypothetical protein
VKLRSAGLAGGDRTRSLVGEAATLDARACSSSTGMEEERLAAIRRNPASRACVVLSISEAGLDALGVSVAKTH